MRINKQKRSNIIVLSDYIVLEILNKSKPNTDILMKKSPRGRAIITLLG